MYLIRNCCGFTLTLSIIIGRCFVLRESDQNRSVRLAKTLILYIHIASFTSVIKRWLASKSKIRIRFELFNRLTIYMIFESTVKKCKQVSKQVLQARPCVSKFLIGGVRAAGSSLSSASLFTYTVWCAPAAYRCYRSIDAWLLQCFDFVPDQTLS